MAARMRIRIPKSDHKALVLLLQASNAQMQDLVTAINRTGPEYSPEDFAAKVREALPQEEKTLDELVRLAVVLYMTRSTTNLALPKFLDQVVEAMRAADSNDLHPEGANWDDFRAKLGTLLQLDESVGMVAKSFELRREHQRTLHDARIFTDMRPIFFGDPPIPAAGVITHELQIAYHEDGELRRLFVALDASDIRRLAEQCDRAQKKADALQSRMEAASFLILEDEAQ